MPPESLEPWLRALAPLVGSCAGFLPYQTLDDQLDLFERGSGRSPKDDLQATPAKRLSPRKVERSTNSSGSYHGGRRVLVVDQNRAQHANTNSPTPLSK